MVVALAPFGLGRSPSVPFVVVGGRIAFLISEKVVEPATLCHNVLWTLVNIERNLVVKRTSAKIKRAQTDKRKWSHEQTQTSDF